LAGLAEELAALKTRLQAVESALARLHAPDPR